MREPLAVPTVPVVRSLNADGHQVVTWTCPACEVRHVDEHEIAEDAVRCCACGADFVSVEASDAPEWLSPEDARAVELDALIYGLVVVERTPGGGARRVPPTECAECEVDEAREASDA